jgi:hypothetical protein
MPSCRKPNTRPWNGGRPAPPPSALSDDEIERRIDQHNVERFATMLREEPEKYWRSPELQQQHRDAIAGTIREAPA